jgi:riboflavin biosynthesis pyrimidine reductase
VILTPVYPRFDPPIDIFAAGARERITELYRLPAPERVRINLIASVSGSAAGSDGTSDTLSSPADRLILKVIRALSDVVVVGAASVRAEGYFVPKDGVLAVVSRTGDFTGHHIRDTGNHGTLLILCPASAVRTAQSTIGLADVTVVAVPDVEGSLSAGAILGALGDQGFSSIVAEGGPALARHLVLGGVVDELCLTTSPVLNGGRLPMFGAGEFDGHPMALNQLLVDEGGFTYARWGLRKPV